VVTVGTLKMQQQMSNWSSKQEAESWYKDIIQSTMIG